MDGQRRHEPDLSALGLSRPRATAFGQLKITGSIDADLHQQALLALACQQWLNTVARSKYPDWEYADQESERLALMNAALEQASTA